MRRSRRDSLVPSVQLHPGSKPRLAVRTRETTRRGWSSRACFMVKLRLELLKCAPDSRYGKEKSADPVCRARGTWDSCGSYPPLKRWAFLCCPPRRGGWRVRQYQGHTFEMAASGWAAARVRAFQQKDANLGAELKEDPHPTPKDGVEWAPWYRLPPTVKTVGFLMPCPRHSLRKYHALPTSEEVGFMPRPWRASDCVVPAHSGLLPLRFRSTNRRVQLGLAEIAGPPALQTDLQRQRISCSSASTSSV